MLTNKLKYGMNTGAIVGLAISLLSIIGLIAYPVLLFYFIKRYRDTWQEGFITFRESLQVGIFISFFGSIIIGFFAVLMLVFVGIPKESLEMYSDYYEAGELEVMLDTITPMNMMFSAVVMFTIVGYILSLIVATFVKQEKINSNAE